MDNTFSIRKLLAVKTTWFITWIPNDVQQEERDGGKRMCVCDLV